MKSNQISMVIELRTLLDTANCGKHRFFYHINSLRINKFIFYKYSGKMH